MNLRLGRNADSERNDIWVVFSIVRFHNGACVLRVIGESRGQVERSIALKRVRGLFHIGQEDIASQAIFDRAKVDFRFTFWFVWDVILLFVSVFPLNIGTQRQTNCQHCNLAQDRHGIRNNATKQI